MKIEYPEQYYTIDTYYDSNKPCISISIIRHRYVSYVFNQKSYKIGKDRSFPIDEVIDDFINIAPNVFLYLMNKSYL